MAWKHRLGPFAERRMSLARNLRRRSAYVCGLCESLMNSFAIVLMHGTVKKLCNETVKNEQIDIVSHKYRDECDVCACVLCIPYSRYKIKYNKRIKERHFFFLFSLSLV